MVSRTSAPASMFTPPQSYDVQGEESIEKQGSNAVRRGDNTSVRGMQSVAPTDRVCWFLS